MTEAGEGPLTQERLKKLLHYDLSTGIFTWKVATGRVKPGTVAGAISSGYTQINVDKHRCYAHRLAFLWMEGAWPEIEVDHINGKKSDNRWANLRKASHSDNQLNRGKLANNTSGAKNVSVDTRNNTPRYRATLTVKGALVLNTRFDTLEEAASKVAAVREQYHGSFVNHGE